MYANEYQWSSLYEMIWWHRIRACIWCFVMHSILLLVTYAYLWGESFMANVCCYIKVPDCGLIYDMHLVFHYLYMLSWVNYIWYQELGVDGGQDCDIMSFIRLSFFWQICHRCSRVLVCSVSETHVTTTRNMRICFNILFDYILLSLIIGKTYTSILLASCFSRYGHWQV